MILVQYERKDLKKYYHTVDIHRSPLDSGVDDLIEGIVRRYHDAKYTIRKPRFSQIGRPKKIVHERPLIFVGCSDHSLGYIHYLKQNNIPVNCVFLNDENDWHMEIPGRCLKSDFYIPKKDLVQNILAVIEQERLILMDGGDELKGALSRYGDYRDSSVQPKDVKPLDDIVLALAMPVWYYENLLSIRPRSP